MFSNTPLSGDPQIDCAGQSRSGEHCGSSRKPRNGSFSLPGKAHGSAFKSGRSWYTSCYGLASDIKYYGWQVMVELSGSRLKEQALTRSGASDAKVRVVRGKARADDITAGQ